MSAVAEVTRLAALGTGLAAVVAGALALVVTRRPLPALAVLLDLLLAAGLLRLAGDPDWQGIVTAAAIVALRHLIGVGLRAGGRAWTGPRPPAASAQEKSAL
ncbi:DUF1622 domain-containing protein [Blastococcus tunisiensis]|uniref:DUF1622 domain-containing protein n=1 Tax=Blastococcus tunisiensis TaxID=1798228 RepID=A0A1I2FCS6_9ACTN|nr:DUF1622 domain-containing protein [Blastococcus sp. DSM 46838]SFF03182.1 Protein of unknown function [Blastococcus sp. DSM 46838]